MKKLMLSLSIVVCLFVVVPSASAREQGSERPASAAVEKHSSFTPDGTNWWVIEQIIQRIQEYIGSHR